MSGICGIVQREHDILPQNLEPMVKAMEHRGPDGAGTRYFPGVGLGNTRLAVIDLTSAGNQPMTNEDGTVWITYDGEIYNYGELRDKLISKGHRFSSATDTEVIIHLYEEYGKDCLGYLRGMFAFAIWDERNKSLFLARDRLGVKPLYYVYYGDRLIFASEIKAILSAKLLPKKLNTQAVLAYFLFGSIPPPLTIFEGVNVLPPGHHMELQNGRMNPQSYWELSFQPKENIGKEQATTELRSLLEQAMNSHIMSDAPLGAFISGGIDSSIIVAIVSRLISSPLRTFSITFPEISFSESHFARLVAARFETNHTEYEVTSDNVKDQLTAIIRAMDQPTVDGVNTYFVSKAAREAGIVVALSGLGGDELFHGYSSFTAIPRMHRRLTPLRYMPVSMRKPFCWPLSRGALGGHGKKLAYLISSALSIEDIYFAWRSCFVDSDLACLINPDVWRQEDLSVGSEYVKSMGRRCNARDPVDRISFLELMTYMSNQLLWDTDVMSMAHSLEVRTPYLDDVLVEFASKLPANLRKAEGRPKGLLLESVDGLLPPEVVERKKMGFEFPFYLWLREGLRPLVSEVLSPKNIEQLGLLQPRAVSSLWQNFLHSKKGIGWSRVWAILIFQLWCNEVLRSQS